MGDGVGGVVLLVALLGTLLFAGAWTVADLRPSAARLWCRAAVLPPLVLGVAMVLHVAGEDPYRHDGRSRWEVYDAHLVTSLAIAAAAGAAVAGHAARDRARVGPVAACACAVSSLRTFAALVQMTN
jgi:hypothetical protein